jgi:preprotein translocase subunit SecF
VSVRSAIATFRGQREFHTNLIGRRRWWFALSGLLLAASLIGLFARQLNLSIDFRGGAILEVPNEAGVSTDDIERTLAEIGHADAVVQEVGENITVRTESLDEGELEEVLGVLADDAGVTTDQISVESIGPKWGQQISAKALQALIVFLIGVSIYIALRFEWKVAVASLASLFHDLIITSGVYALTGREVTPETVIAILTILGYSLYDNVVIFDKINENAESAALTARLGYAGVVNLSLNQVLMRSLNTALSSLVPIGALMLFGGETLKDFAFALFVGMLAGTYSSIFVAAPIVAALKEREPRLAQIRERIGRREAAARPRLRAVSRDGPAEGERDLEPMAAARPSTPPQVSSARRKPKKKPRSKRRRR